MHQPLLADFLHALRPHIQGDLRADQYDRLLYSSDASIYQVLPHAVLIPRTVDDVQAAMRVAADYGMPVLARGGGSSLAGQAVNAALVIDTSRHLDQILEINVEARWARVQPGVILDSLNAAVRPHGLHFGPDPASSQRATLGGCVSNNATGAHSIRYGMTADHVRRMRVVLADGTPLTLEAKSTRDLLQYQTRGDREAQLYRQMAALTFNERNRQIVAAGTPRHWRRCGGYNLDRLVGDQGISFRWPHDPRFNLARLVCGAEGTLGLITELTLDLVARPAHTALALVQFDDPRAALEAVPLLLTHDPSAVELLDPLGLRLARGVPAYARLLDSVLDGAPGSVQVVEFDGDDPAELAARIDKLRADLLYRSPGVSRVLPATTPEAQAAVWQVRKVTLGFLMGIAGNKKPLPFIEDAAVPPEHLADYIGRLEAFCADLGTSLTYYAHASAGCLHVRPLIDTQDATDIAKMPQIVAFAIELLGDYGGVLSSEHGDGRARSWANERFFGTDLYALYRRVKQIWDPANLLNPGNIVDAGPMTSDLRYRPAAARLLLTTHLDFAAEGGLHAAVDNCNGAGVCRKLGSGAMCPSFMATREEEHSTRGRANALRAVLDGHLPPAELSGERLYQTLALCVSCKACKAECPSAVDLAKLKTEFLAHYHAAHGVPLRARLFAHIGLLNRLGWRAAPLVNRLLRVRSLRQYMQRALGIGAARPLPVLARRPFSVWWRRHVAAGLPPAPNGPIVLLTDTYSTHNHPTIAIAAVELLERLGYRVIPSFQTCVGRPALSKGVIGAARRYARQTLDRLAPFAAQGMAIVGLEPSDVSAITDDYAALLPGDRRVATVAAQTQLIETWLATQFKAGRLPARSPAARPLLLHGHCHQKALFGMAATHTLLATWLGYHVQEPDTSCCGMAGSFGFEAEHQALAWQMAERRLLPAVRAAATNTPIVAGGVSCRQQIADGSGRAVYHPVELVRAAFDQALPP